MEAVAANRMESRKGHVCDPGSQFLSHLYVCFLCTWYTQTKSEVTIPQDRRGTLEPFYLWLHSSVPYTGLAQPAGSCFCVIWLGGNIVLSAQKMAQ